MMAKMFYTLDETKAALGKNEEEIKQYTREGKLREFRDGPRLMFKADQVDTLRNELGGGGSLDHVDLGPSDSGSPIGLVDSKGASGTSITLGDTDAGGSVGGLQMKDDTGTPADLGMTGSMGGIPSPARTGTGVTVFRPDEVERADPMAQTSISSTMQDQINLEGVGSGSGLLDLTRESDDTSLGAELLDEITPGSGGARRGAAAPADASRSGTGLGSLSAPSGGRVISAPVYVEAADPMAPAFGAAALAATIVLIFGGFVTTAAVSGYWPDIVRNLTEGGRGVLFLGGIGLGLAIVFFIVGLLIGRSGRK
jgi:hypothetical protein